MRFISLKKGIAWDTIGRLLLVLLFLIIALTILGMIIAKSGGLVEKLKPTLINRTPSSMSNSYIILGLS